MGIATSVEAVTTLLTLGGLVYMLLALWSARDFEHAWRRSLRASAADTAASAPEGSILKPMKGGAVRGTAADTAAPAPAVSNMKPMTAVASRLPAPPVSPCRKQYAGSFE